MKREDARGKGAWTEREKASGKGKGTDEEKTKEREKKRGKCGIAKKRRGNFTRSFEKSHKKSVGSEKNEEKGRYAKKIKPRKTMI